MLKSLETISPIKNYLFPFKIITQWLRLCKQCRLIVSLLLISVLGCGWFSVKSPTLKFSSSHTADLNEHKALNERVVMLHEAQSNPF